MQRAVKLATRIFNCGVLIVILALSSVMIPITGESLERRFFPVVVDIELQPVQTDDHTSFLFKVKGDKVRTCDFVELRTLVKVGDEWVKGGIIFLNDEPTLPRSRGLGQQSFGFWKVRPPGDEVKIEAVHDCHAWWQTTSEIGIWDMKRGVKK